MSYESVDKLQNLLAQTTFSYSTDRKKAAGRALGTFIELIAFYLIKAWGFETFSAIEQPLPEYANPDISHNVEFTLHGNRKIIESSFADISPPCSSSCIWQMLPEEMRELYSRKNTQLLDRSNVLRNACTLASAKDSFLNVYADTRQRTFSVYELHRRPFAMFECKRVGVEEGQRKGPQTIEKAKQGSYVARTVSALQRIRRSDGSLAGIIPQFDGRIIIDDYYTLLDKIIQSRDQSLLKNIILTIGVVSNHGNWFTSDNPNKELKVLSQSYDWLLFLTDQGISEFITDLLMNPRREYHSVKDAFEKSYCDNKKGNIFTKVKIDFDADIALNAYFEDNMSKIESWINIISPISKPLSVLKQDLCKLSLKDWWEIYK